MQVGAGILAMLPWAAMAGWWLLGAILLAALGCLLARRGDAEPADRLSRSLRAGGRLGRVVLFASLFGVYVVPGLPSAGAAAFVVVVAAADVAGVRISPYWRRWVTGTLLVAAAGFVALCVAIPPATPRHGEAFTVGGLVIATVVSVPLFAGLDRRRIVAGAAAAIAVAAAVLYQLGPWRLSLSPVALRDVLVAADAAALLPLLAGVVVLATVPSALVALTGARDDTRVPGRFAGTLPLAAGAAVLAAVLPLGWALLLAATLAILEVAAGSRRSET